MKKYIAFLWGLFLVSGWSMSCTSDHDDLSSEISGKGGIRIGLSTETGFESRAVDESHYANKNNYTVQILKNGKVIEGGEYKYSELPDELIELTSGSYVLKAFCGEDEPYSRTSMYVVGEEPFDIQSNQVQNKIITCTPTCAKVTVDFDPDMKTYFNQYSVILQTAAMKGGSVDWRSTDTDPWYLRASKTGDMLTVKFILTDIEGKTASIADKTYTIKAKQALKLTVKPLVQSTNGQLGITITIDEGTTSKPVDIVIPTEWMN